MNARLQRTFLLRVVPEPTGRYLLSLKQRPTAKGQARRAQKALRLLLSEE